MVPNDSYFGHDNNRSLTLEALLSLPVGDLSGQVDAAAAYRAVDTLMSDPSMPGYREIPMRLEIDTSDI